MSHPSDSLHERASRSSQAIPTREGRGPLVPLHFLFLSLCYIKSFLTGIEVPEAKIISDQKYL